MQLAHHEFLEKILKIFEIQSSELVHISDSLGRVLSSDIRAKHSSPHTDVAAINGYALIAKSGASAPVELEVIGESTAGMPFVEEVEMGQAVKVYAGSPIPLGADTVIPIHDTTLKGRKLTINKNTMHGQNICYAGVDFALNEPVLKEGYIMTPRDIGLAASMKISWINVRRKPRIGIMAIGDELAMLGDESDTNKTISSSSLILESLITAGGARAVNLGIACDSEHSINKLTDHTDNVDLLVTTGGVSASADNLLRKTLDKGNKPIETTIKINDPTSIFIGQRNNIPLLALPGNPISAHICATLFLKPIIRKMKNINNKLHKETSAFLDRNLDENDLEMDYIFSRLTEDENKILKALPASSYDRLLMSALSEADCMITVDKNNCNKGDPVKIMRFVSSVSDG